MKLKTQKCYEARLGSVDIDQVIELLEPFHYDSEISYQRTLPKGTIGYKADKHTFVVIANALLGIYTIRDTNPLVRFVRFPITLEKDA